MHKRVLFFFVTILQTLICQQLFSQTAVHQTEIRLINQMPDLPTPYKMKDWKLIAKKQDRLLYNFNAKGSFLPLIWWDTNEVNFPTKSFGLPSYVGSLGSLQKGTHYEALPVMGSILGASLAGIDKSNYNGHDFVSMCKQFYNTANGVNLVMNGVNREPGSSFWYEIWPGMAFNMIVDQYPGNNDLSEIMKKNAEHWLTAINELAKGKEFPDFNYTSFDFKTTRAVYNGRWREPDAAAGLAWLEFTAWKKFGDDKFLEASKSCMEFLQNRPKPEGPFYEIMMPYGAYLAVRMNAEFGTGYDELKMLDWCFDGDNSDRDGWGVITGKWGKYDVDGLVGQKKEEQYAFAMNTFSHAAALLPIVKYNSACSRAIGKWILNLANASRLFYADEHPRNRQSSAIWDGDPQHVICYEGLRKDLDHNNNFYIFKGVLADDGPYAIGDQVKQCSSFTDICLYGSAWVGMLAAIIDTTNVPGILKLDCNATDFFSSGKFPTFLLFNPHKERKNVQLNVGRIPVNIYDKVSKNYIAKNVTGNTSLRLESNDAMTLVLVPSNLRTSLKGRMLVANNEIIDFRYE